MKKLLIFPMVALNFMVMHSAIAGTMGAVVTPTHWTGPYAGVNGGAWPGLALTTHLLASSLIT